MRERGEGRWEEGKRRRVRVEGCREKGKGKRD
jgi:hypothetical protein